MKYDGWNRFAGIDSNGDTDFADAGEVRYTYDGLGQRIAKDFAGGTADDLDYYYNEHWQVLEVRKAGDADPLERYIWDETYADAPVTIERDVNTDGVRDQRLWATYDANYNVTSVLTDGGKLVERYVYTPYGTRTVLNGSSNYAGTGSDPDGADWQPDGGGDSYDVKPGHQGLMWDAETGQWQNRHRFMSSSLGVFTQRDPSGYTDSWNAYNYRGGNALIHVDPFGLSFKPIMQSIGNGALAAGYVVADAGLNAATTVAHDVASIGPFGPPMPPPPTTIAGAVGQAGGHAIAIVGSGIEIVEGVGMAVGGVAGAVPTDGISLVGSAIGVVAVAHGVNTLVNAGKAITSTPVRIPMTGAGSGPTPPTTPSSPAMPAPTTPAATPTGGASLPDRIEAAIQETLAGQGDILAEATSLEDISSPHSMANPDTKLGPNQVRFRSEVTGEYQDISVNYDPDSGEFGTIKPASGK